MRRIIALGIMFALMAPVPAPAAASSTMRAISSIEDRAEAIAEGETAGAIAVVAARESIAKWPSLRADLSQKGAPAPQLTRMDACMKELARNLHDSLRLKRAANDVTGALAPLFGIAGDSIPPDLHDLDYLGRSIGLDVSMAQWSRASRDAYALNRVWLQLKPSVAAKPNSGKVVRMFDAADRQARDGAHDRNAKETRAGATAVGNAVDAVEGLYTP